MQRTRFTELFGIAHPIVQGGMQWVGRAELAAELFISPMGISFVAIVAPPKHQGIMQGAWLGATAVGNSLLFIGAIFYKSISMSATWMIFVVACLISMFTMLAMIKWLERIAK